MTDRAFEKTEYSAGDPVCPAADTCGGCSYQGVPYELQLSNKLGEVRGALKKNGIDEALLTGIRPCEDRFAYRNKMEYAFGNECRGGEMKLGLHKKGSYMSIIDAGSCMLVSPDFNVILKAVLSFCKERGYVHYHQKLHTGFLRYLVLRKGFRTGEILVNIVTTSSQPFDEEGFVSLIGSLQLKDSVCGILHTINDDPADSVLCQELRVLSGRDHYFEEILGLRFRVGAFSFFQTNVSAAERLYADALSLIPGIEGKTVYDLYCGCGTITQAMALKAKKVIGVEINAEAVESARTNAALNGLDNCEFVAGDVQNVLDVLSEKPDVIVVDPPRSGIMPKALSKILSYGVEQLLYISCNPKTMADNLRAAALSGYKINFISAYDNFPFTRHIESVVLLTKNLIM